MEGYKASNLDHQPDLVIVGNVIRRDNPEAQAVRDQGFVHELSARSVPSSFTISMPWSSPAPTGTTTSMVAPLHFAKLDPTFLVGGIPLNFGQSFRVGQGCSWSSRAMNTTPPTSTRSPSLSTTNLRPPC